MKQLTLQHYDAVSFYYTWSTLSIIIVMIVLYTNIILQGFFKAQHSPLGHATLNIVAHQSCASGIPTSHIQED